MSAIPKPIHTRLAYSLKQLMHKNAVHGQQIINMQTAAANLQATVANLQTGLSVTAPAAAGSAYSEAQAASVVAAITDLITALQNAGVIS